MRSSLLSLCLFSLVAEAQPFAIGERSLTLFDADRNRSIPTQVRYPALSNGANAPFAEGEFPLLVFGHGFLMTTDAYANIWEQFVPLGYIVALPTTEGGILPDHAAFGLDLAFVVSGIQAAGTDAGSPFLGHVAQASALMGHSMGGGASFLAAAGNSSVTTVVNLAAAETNPSAVAACADVLVPTLMFAGSNDCVTPIPQHTAPMYQALATPCRAFINISGAGHCYFAESNFNCSLGEITCSPAPSITRPQQHDVVNDFATLWLNHFLKGDDEAWGVLIDSMATTNRASCESSCALSTMVSAEGTSTPVLAPMPADRYVRLLGLQEPASVQVHDAQGRLCLQAWVLVDGQFDVGALAVGTYSVTNSSARGKHQWRMVVSR